MGGSKTKEILMKNIGVKVLITNQIIWNSKQIKKQSNNGKTRQKPDDKNTKTNISL